MRSKCFGVVLFGLLADAALPSIVYANACNLGDVCTTQTIQDFYSGGLNTFNGQDVIGPSSVFDVTSAVVTLDATTNTLTVQINTNFAGAPASSNPYISGALLGQSYGALFLGPAGAGSIWSANHPTPPGPGNTYPNDLYHPGEWTVAVNMNGTGNSGTAGVYSVGGPQNGGTQTPVPSSENASVPVAYNTKDSHNNNLGQVVMSNEYGNPVTFPNSGNGGNYFRQGQAVQFNPDASATTISGTGSSAYAITPTIWDPSGNVISEGSITYTLTDFSALGLNGDIALSWAESCGNDVLQGVVNVSAVPGPVAGSGLPGLVAVCGGLLARWRRKRRAVA
jgi:hypothetical protein